MVITNLIVMRLSEPDALVRLLICMGVGANERTRLLKEEFNTLESFIAHRVVLV